MFHRHGTRDSLNAANDASSRVSATAGMVMIAELRKNFGSSACCQASM